MHSDSAVPHDSVQLVDGFPSDISLRKCQSDPEQQCQYSLESRETKFGRENESAEYISVVFQG